VSFPSECLGNLRRILTVEISRENCAIFGDGDRRTRVALQKRDSGFGQRNGCRRAE
jgi:hypothetical protein